MATALTFRAESDFIDAIRTYSEKVGLSVNAALKEIIAPAIGLSRRRSNIPKNNLAEFCGALKDVDCSELEATQSAFSEIDAEMWK
jgi:hypothetical protein